VSLSQWTLLLRRKGVKATFASVQSTHKIPGASAMTWSKYLISQSSRGDYYTRAEPGVSGVPGEPAPTCWHGPRELLRSYGIDASRPVRLEHLRALMRGVSPKNGEPIRPAGANGTRTAGIDMTFSPPKDVSALWASASPYRRAQIEAAHRRAVASALARTEREVAVVRRKEGGVVRFEKARRLLAAESVHTTSRLARDQQREGVPDPQLHSHVVVIAAQRQDGKMAAVESRQLFLAARENGAWYRSELAANLKALGLPIERHAGKDERYFAIRGVSQELSERWSSRARDVDRAAQVFRSRYGREPRARELDNLTLQTRGGKTTAQPIDVDAAWRAVASEHGQTSRRAEELFNARGLRKEPAVDLRVELLAEVTRERATITEHELRAKAYERSAGVCRPAQTNRLVRELIRTGELIRLKDGTWTTRALRKTEQATLQIAVQRSDERVAPVSEKSLRQARRELAREIKGTLSSEQQQALQTITGPGGVIVLIGQAGTGKGVVTATAARAWELEGTTVIGTAIAGVTAQRLKDDAQLQHAYTTDGLVRAIENGQIRLDGNTVVIMDEAGMTDTDRVSKLTRLTAQRDAKLVLIGDSAQLSSIGAGGMFKQLQEHVPHAELTEVHRANHQWERQAWEQVRVGEPGPALASYQAHKRLHIHDTRAQATQAMVKDWDQTRREVPDSQAVMITDASNKERDQINAMAQEHRVRAGELGAHRVTLPGKPYGLAAGDEIVFTSQYRIPNTRRIENGITGTILHTSRDESRVTIKTHEHEPREVTLDTSEFSDLSLAYAVHTYKAQGLTTQTSGVMIGGWQTDKETAYVTLSRAREQTQIYLSREDLGEQGMDAGAIERLVQRIRRSRTQETSIAKQTASERETPSGSHDRAEPDLESNRAREPRRRPARDQAHDEHIPHEHPRETPTHRVKRDAREHFAEHQSPLAKIPINIHEANPRDVRIATRDVGETRVAYSTQLYDLNGQTNQPTYVLFGAWQTTDQLNFIATTRDEHGHTHTHIDTEQREDRELENALTERIQAAIERSQSPEPAHTQEPNPSHTSPTNTIEQATVHQPELELIAPAATPPPTHEPADHPTTHQPERERIERDPYIEQAIQEAQDHQQAFEHSIDHDRDNDIGLGIE
jgi:conjugative relaxase-like TrwC/TraI family protein